MARTSEVEAGAGVGDSRGRDRVDVSLTQQQVRRAVQLDLGVVLGLKQHSVTGLDGAHVLAGRRPPRPS